MSRSQGLNSLLAELACEEKPSTPEQLHAALVKFNEPNEFKVGDMVRWKDGMKNKRIEAPFIVAEKLADPIVDTKEGPGSAYFREPLDMIIGHIDVAGDFTMLHVDSRRFEPYNEMGYELVS